MSTEKKFVGRVSQVPTKFGPLTKVGISRKDFDKYQENDWLNVIIKTSKEGKVYLEVDDWKPDPKFKKEYNSKDDFPTPIGGDDHSLPF